MSHPGVYASPWRLVLTDSDGHLFCSVPFRAAAGANAEHIESPEAHERVIVNAHVIVPILGRVNMHQQFALERGCRLSIDPGQLKIDIQEA